MTVQLTYGAQAIGREGQIASSAGTQIDSYNVESTSADIKAGLLVAYSATMTAGSDKLVRALPVFPVADVDGIAVTVASAVAEQDLTGATLDGVTSDSLMSPARRITFIKDASADWGLAALGFTIVTVYGEDAMGAPIHEELAVSAAAGAATYTTGQCFSRVIRVHIGANDGAGGTATIGTAVGMFEVGSATHPGIAVYTPGVEPASTVGEFDQGIAVGVMRKGRIFLVNETTAAGTCTRGDPVYVRGLLAGADVRGQFTGHAGGATPATWMRVLGARWTEAVAAGAVGEVEINW